MELQIISRDISSVLEQIDRLSEEGKLDQLIHDLNWFGKLVGIAKAKALFLREKSWNNPDESFRDYAVREYTMRSENIKRYIDVWNMILKTPEHLRDYFLRKPMDQLIPLGTYMAEDEIDPNDIDWDSYLGTTSSGDAYNEIRKMSGEEAAERIKIYIDMKTGDISSWYAEQYEHIGYLDVERMDVEQVKKSVYRIINKAGLREKENS